MSMTAKSAPTAAKNRTSSFVRHSILVTDALIGNVTGSRAARLHSRRAPRLVPRPRRCTGLFLLAEAGSRLEVSTTFDGPLTCHGANHIHVS